MLTPMRRRPRRSLVLSVLLAGLMSILMTSNLPFVGGSAKADEPTERVVETTQLAGGGELKRIQRKDGTTFSRVQSPKLDESSLFWAAEIPNTGGNIRVEASLTGPRVAPKTASRVPAIPPSYGDASAASMPFGSCQATMARGIPVYPFEAWVKLTTSWNYNYSTTWGASNSTQKFDGAGYEWRSVDKWLSNVGEQYAYSDADAELWLAAYWPVIQISSDHMWHQIDAWGNCTAYFDFYP